MKQSLKGSLRRFLIGPEKNIQRNSYIWNMMAGLFNAGQSVVLLMVLTRTVGIVESGIFTIAYASAALFLTVGNYGMRSYQVTDVSGRYRFADYLGSRIVTCAVMAAMGALYALYGYLCNGYSAYKAAVALCVCLMRMVDAGEDVFTAFYQQKGRLDVGAKITFTRQVISVLCMCILLFAGNHLLVSSIAALMVSIAVSIIFHRTVIGFFQIEKPVFSAKRALGLLKDCMGPFLAAFFSFYLANAPKYSIDAYLSQEMQAYYGFISMPVLVVGLLNSFLYQPILPSLAADWEEGRQAAFLRRAGKQLVVIFVITGMVLAGAYFLGIPVLSLLYHTDLRPYKAELLILLAGSGMLAVAGFVNILLTILRRQQDLIGGYFLIAALAFGLSPVFVRKWGIAGASWIYMILVSGLAVLFTVILAVRLRGAKKNARGMQ